jgi:pimeloyl-ACP methyl ester carboxylesterase
LSGPEGALEIPEGPKVWRIAMRDGLTLHVEEWGSRRAEGTPLLCLSGLTRNAWDFETLARRHSGKRRVVTFDFRGRGRSDFDPEPLNYNPRQYLEDIQQVCAALCLHGFVAVGTSMGGLLTFGLGVVMPSALRGAVINDIGPVYESSGLQRILDYVGSDHPVETWDEALRTLEETFPEGSYPRADRATWNKIAKTSFKRGGDGKLHASWDVRIAQALTGQDEGEFDLWALFESLKPHPLLLLRGETSDLLSAETAEEMCERHGKMSLVTVAGTPHAPTLDESEAIKAIDDFLDECDRAERHPDRH